jgi:hypothetical protein
VCAAVDGPQKAAQIAGQQHVVDLGERAVAKQVARARIADHERVGVRRFGELLVSGGAQGIASFFEHSHELVHHCTVTRAS